MSVHVDGCRRRFGVMMVMMAVALSTGQASAQWAECGPGAGPCFEPHDGVGCDSVACCTITCDFDPPCCQITWDIICAKEALELCEDVPCPREGSCFEAHDTPGCDDESCCFFTCVFDGFCCNTSWDVVCALEAERLCGASPCTITVPPGAKVESELCGERLNDGCNTPGGSFAPINFDCGDVIEGTCSSGTPRDSDWYRIELPAPARVQWTVNAEFPAQLLALEGTCAGALHIVAEAYGGGCTPATLQACLPAGTWYLIVSVGVPARNFNSGVPCPDDDPKTEPGFFGNRYVAELACLGCGSPADLNGDGIVDGADLGLLLANWSQPGLGDLNNDGIVDGADLGMLLAEWGK